MPRDRATGRIHGRSDIFDMVGGLVGRPRESWGADLPVVTLLGPNGSGKTLLLSMLGEAWGAELPFAHLDLGDGQPYRDRRRVLLELSWRLGLHRSRWVRRLRFPRLWLGLAALRDELDENPARAHAQLGALLATGAMDDAVVSMVESAAADVTDARRAQLGVAVPGQRELARLVSGVRLRGPAALLEGRQWSIARRWFGDYDDRFAGDGVACLVELNRRARRGGEAERDSAEQALVEAFLDDLRAQFQSGISALDRLVNCLVLLDNADSEVGQSFLSLLLRERRDHAARRPADCDPLLVVATSRRRLGDLLDRPYPVAAAPAALAAWRRQDHAGDERRWLLPRPLVDLEPWEVHEMARSRRVPGVPGLALAVHRLTGGHPQGVAESVAALAEVQDLAAEPGLAVRSVVDRVDGSVLDHLLEGLDRRLREDLVTCAAARRIGEAVFQGVLPGLIVTDSRTVREALAQHLWATERGAGTSQEFVLHPLLRRLLLRRLALRPADHDAPWEVVHGLLQQYYERIANQREDDEEARIEDLHHCLALDDADPAVDHVIERFSEVDDGWFDRLRAMTAGAVPRDDTALRVPAPKEHRFGRHLAHLVVMVWTSEATTDPLALATLYGQIGQMLETVDDGHLGPLLRRADAYRALQRAWRQAVPPRRGGL